MDPQRSSETVTMAVPQQRQTVLWIIAILLAVIATALVVRSEPLLPQPALGDAPMVGARGIFAFTGQLDKNRNGLFMMDVDNGTIWCYEYLPATRKLVLVAARTFRYDRYLEDYNNDPETAPVQVQTLLKNQNRIKERINGGGAAPEESDDELGTNVPGFPYPQGDGKSDQNKTGN
jgi:hypothetical protein